MADNPRTTPGASAALSISGSDSSGGAGVQAHLKTFTAMGVYGASAITAVTAQNTTGVKAAKTLDPKLIEDQITAVAGDLNIAATCTGMMANTGVIDTVVASIKRANLYPLVVDAVMVNKNGDSLLEENAMKALTKKLLPEAAVVTANCTEAAMLTDRDNPIDDVAGAISAAKEIMNRFKVRAVVVMGVNRPNDAEGEAVDVFYSGEAAQELVSEWRQTKNTHGAGSTFTAAITASLALGNPLEEAVQTAKNVVAETIRQATDLGAGRGPVNHAAYIKVK